MNYSLEIFTAASGFPSAKVILPDNTTRHLHSTVDPENEYKYFEDINFWGDHIIFLGFGAGYHVLNKIKKIPRDTKITVIDTFEEFTTNAQNELFKEFHIDTICLKDDVKVACQTLSSSSNTQIIKHPSSYNLNPEFYDSITLQLNKSYKPNSQIKKVMLLQGSFFLENEISNALNKNSSLSFSKFPYNEFSSAYEFENNFYKTLCSEKPDLIISVNCKGFDGNGYVQKVTKEMGIPVAIWFVDDPHPILLNHKKNINDNISAFCWEKGFINYLKEFPFSNVHYLPLACDPDLFKFNSIQTPAADVGFIGSSMGNAFLNDIKSKYLWNHKLDTIIKKSAEELLIDPSLNIWNIIKSISSNEKFDIPFNDDRNRTWLCSHAIHTASMLLRKNIVESIENLEIYGDPEGWREIIGNKHPLHNNIDYQNSLCQMYQDIKININITSRQMATAVNQRVFDVPMSGSFLITDNQPDLQNLFEIDKEVVIYESIDDLNNKIKYYLNNESQRNLISSKARDRILKAHTYENRVDFIINNI